MIKLHLLLRSALAALGIAATIVIVQAPIGLPASAQAISMNGGSIQGTVTDPTGAVLPGATVTISNPDTGYSHTEATSSAGLYSIGPLIPGS
jgi:hypothetical protein